MIPGRVIHQLTEYGREVSYTYAQGLMTIVADAETGENPNIWRSDEKGRLVALSAADGSNKPCGMIPGATALV